MHCNLKIISKYLLNTICNTCVTKTYMQVVCVLVAIFLKFDKHFTYVEKSQQSISEKFLLRKTTISSETETMEHDRRSRYVP